MNYLIGFGKWKSLKFTNNIVKTQIWQKNDSRKVFFIFIFKKIKFLSMNYLKSIQTKIMVQKKEGETEK